MSICFLWRNSERTEKNPPKKHSWIWSELHHLHSALRPSLLIQPLITLVKVTNTYVGMWRERLFVVTAPSLGLSSSLRGGVTSWWALALFIWLAVCRWHRLTLGGKEKTGTQSKVWTRERDLTAKAQVTTAQGMTQIHVTLANDQTQQSKHVEIQRMEKQTLKAHKTHTQHRLRRSHSGAQASL